MFYNNEEMETAVLERLQMQEPYLCRDGIFKPVPRWDECIIVFEDYGYKVVRLQRKK
jgi:hypothetical protein